MGRIHFSLAFFAIASLFHLFGSTAVGDVVKSEEPMLDLRNAEKYQLKPDEKWPDEIAHLFDDGKDEAKGPKKPRKRVKRWTEWVSEKHEFREDSWDEPDKKILNKLPDEPKFIAYQINGTYVMSRCASNSAAVVLTIACPQPRADKGHRIVHLKRAYYGWSQMQGKICQYVEGDCTIRYEFLHSQLMLPTSPQNELEWRAIGPQYFCNPWDGNGRERWATWEKRWCSVGLKRSSQTPDVYHVDEEMGLNKWANKYLYSWGKCGSSYDWFDYMQIEYECIDVDESPNPDATRPYHYRECDACCNPICKQPTRRPCHKGAPTPTDATPTLNSTAEELNGIK